MSAVLFNIKAVSLYWLSNFLCAAAPELVVVRYWRSEIDARFNDASAWWINKNHRRIQYVAKVPMCRIFMWCQYGWKLFAAIAFDKEDLDEKEGRGDRSLMGFFFFLMEWNWRNKISKVHMDFKFLEFYKILGHSFPLDWWEKYFHRSVSFLKLETKKKQTT